MNLQNYLDKIKNSTSEEELHQIPVDSTYDDDISVKDYAKIADAVHQRIVKLDLPYYTGR